jgi:hypothetical protein
MKVLAICTLLTSLVLLGGCPAKGTQTTRGPEATLKAYAAALKSGKYDRAYALMSESFRKRHNMQDFVRMLKENDTEVKYSASKLAATSPKEVIVEANLTYGDEDRLKLVMEKGTWKMASDPIDFYSQRTPADALRSFIRAIEGRRYDVVMRFVPEKWAESMTEAKLKQQWEGDKRGEVKLLLKNLKANLAAPINQQGNTATMPYGDKFEVHFIREDGTWKIEDPD